MEEYKYLGNIINNKLKFNLNVSQIHAKCNQRLYFLRKLKNAKVEPTTLTLFYKSIIQSVLFFCILSWFGNCLEVDKSRLRKSIKCTNKLGCVKINNLEKSMKRLSVKRNNSKLKSRIDLQPLYRFHQTILTVGVTQLQRWFMKLPFQ